MSDQAAFEVAVCEALGFDAKAVNHITIEMLPGSTLVEVTSIKVDPTGLPGVLRRYRLNPTEIPWSPPWGPPTVWWRP